jgi:hypothetical protein
VLRKFFPKASASGAAAPIVALGAMGLLTVTQANPAQAVTVLQSFSLTDTFTNFPTATISPTKYFFPFPEFTVQPFNATLGTLTSTQIVWQTTGFFNGFTGNAPGNLGGVSWTNSGSTRVNDISYGGYGISGNGNAADVSPLNAIANPGGNTTLFTSTSNPTIFAAFLGTNPFTIAFKAGINNSPLEFDYFNIASGTASVTSTATVTYTYDAVPVPAPLPLLGIGAALTWSRRLRRRCAQRQG